MSLQFASSTARPASGCARIAAGLLAAALAASGAAQAQTAPGAAASAQGAPVYGPPVPGLCLFGDGEALGQSKAGVSVNQQLEGFVRTIDAELKAASDPIVADDRALAAKKATLSAAEFQAEADKLRQRYAEVAKLRNLRRAQLALTRKQAILAVSKVLAPSLAATITDRRCGVVFERTNAYGAAQGTDITAAVIQRMDAATPSIALQLAPPDAVAKPTPDAKAPAK